MRERFDVQSFDHKKRHIARYAKKIGSKKKEKLQIEQRAQYSTSPVTEL